MSTARCLGISPIRETHGFRATRRSLAALPLKVESSYFRANVSILVSYLANRACTVLYSLLGRIKLTHDIICEHLQKQAIESISIEAFNFTTVSCPGATELLMWC